MNSPLRIWKSEDNSQAAEPRCVELSINDCEGYYSDFTERQVKSLLFHRDSYQ